MIAICDDDLPFAHLLQNRVFAYMQAKNCPVECTVYPSGEALLNDDVSAFTLVFLDVNMAKLNGLETAKILRKRNPHSVLVFVSGFIEYAPSGFEVEAFRYLLKNQLDTHFCSCMDAVFQKLNLARKSITVPFISGTRTIYVDEIMYLESEKHKIIYHLQNTENHTNLYLYQKLDDAGQVLAKDGFLRIHQSFLVNMACIDKIANYEARLVSGAKLPVSQKRFKDVKRTYVFYKVESQW